MRDSSHTTSRPMMAVSSGTMAFNQTGNWRCLRPSFEERSAPCRAACPAGTDLPRVIAEIARGDYREAWRIIRRTNPLSAVCGHVCYHPCQTSCSRTLLDEGIQVQALERFVSDRYLGEGPPIGPARIQSARVAVVGSGPAGLSAAYFLALGGVRSTIFEREAEPGGMLRIGIPPYRLPRRILDGEIDHIRSLGVTFQFSTRVGVDITVGELLSLYDAVFVATGAHRSRKVPNISMGPEVIDGLEFLRRVNLGETVTLGCRVLIIGGGNTALDVSRTALRLGTEPTIVYRRSREQMPAHEEEIIAAEEEGVNFVFLESPLKILRSGDAVRGEFQRMDLGPKDSSGRARPEPIPGSLLTLDADAVILAVGEEADLSFLIGSEESPGVFVGGDAATGSATVVEAVASGRRTARSLLSYLGYPADFPDSMPDRGFDPAVLRIEQIGRSDRVELSRLPPDVRRRGFEEVVLGLDAGRASAEAERCISCGVCTFCDRCWSYCPDGAVVRSPGGYSIDLRYCKGCGICAEECPCGVITMVQEEL